jgi:hypothetical protein
VVALIGALVGAWFGAWYAEVFYPDGVRNVMLVSRSVRSPAVWPYMAFAAMFSTVAGAAYYGYRLLRYHEV